MSLTSWVNRTTPLTFSDFKTQTALDDIVQTLSISTKFFITYGKNGVSKTSQLGRRESARSKYFTQRSGGISAYVYMRTANVDQK